MEKITTPEFRVSFPKVFQAEAFEGQEPKYRCTMLFDKTADLSGLKKLAAQAVATKWPEKDKRPAGIRSPFRNGSEKPNLQGYEGCTFINTSSKQRPGVVDKNAQPILSEDEFYAGCYAHATVVCYAYDKAGNRGVAFGLQNLQKLREGEPFSGRTSAEQDFGPVDSSSDDFSTNNEDTDEMFG